jgi:hypothetical protein
MPRIGGAVEDHKEPELPEPSAPGALKREDLDLMLSELDRQLAELREHADALGSRSGVLLSATAVSVAFLAPTLAHPSGRTTLAALIALIVAVVVGIIALVPIKFRVGPETKHMRMWLDEESAEAVTELHNAKSDVVDRNNRRLGFINYAVWAQCIAVGIAVILAIFSILIQ